MNGLRSGDWRNRVHGLISLARSNFLNWIRLWLGGESLNWRFGLSGLPLPISFFALSPLEDHALRVPNPAKG
ncbi:MAG: hypothetical protein DWI25_02920 [Planctomycetota bacterium]|nr:MAG: hypothetical protein DWI25_02920 [Planctomycetota bacterium]